MRIQFLIPVTLVIVGCGDSYLPFKENKKSYFGVYQVEYAAGIDELAFRVEFREDGVRGKAATDAAPSGVEVSGVSLGLVKTSSDLQGESGYFLIRSRQPTLQDHYTFKWADRDGNHNENSIEMAKEVKLCMTPKSSGLVWQRNKPLSITVCEPGRRVSERLIIEVLEVTERGQLLWSNRREYEIRKGASLEIPSKETAKFKQARIRIRAAREHSKRPENGHDGHGGMMLSRYFSEPVELKHSR